MRSVPRVSRVVPWLLVGLTIGILAVSVASLVALEHSRPEVLDLPELVSFLYGQAVPLTFGVVAALIIRSQPRHPEGWLFGLLALVIAVGQVLDVYTWWYPDSEALARLNGTVSAPGFGLLALLLLLFPDGRPPSPRWRPAVAFTCLVMVLGALIEAGGSTVPWADTTDAASSFVVPVALVGVAVVSLWVRWRHATGPTRQQVKWLAFGASVFGVELTLALVLALMHSLDDESAGSYYVGNLIFVLSLCLIPVAMGIAIVRHHLYDVDKLLSRTITYGLLLVAGAVLYLASLAVFAGLLASRSSPAVLAVATTAAVLLSLNPLRRRLVAWADRRVYGTRAEPAEMMAGVAAELAAYRSPEDGVTQLAAAARQATRARGASVRIDLPDGRCHLVEAGDLSAAGNRTSVPIRVDGVAVGSITVVDPSRHSEGLTLLSRLAALASPAVADMRTLTELRQLRTQIQIGNAELAASRARLAGAEEEERTHLRQVVESEVLPEVVDLQQGLPSVEKIREGDVLGEELDAAARQSRELAERIRGLAHDVLPPVLADRGLAAALRAHVRRHGTDLTLTVPEARRLPEPMEAALYVCGRILVDAVSAGQGPAALTLNMPGEDVHLCATASVESAAVGDHRREDALRLLRDRLAVLGGDVTTAAFEGVTEIRCHVPLSTEPLSAAGGGLNASRNATSAPSSSPLANASMPTT